MSDDKKEIVITYLPSPLQHPFKCPVCGGTGSVVDPSVAPMAEQIKSKGHLVPTKACIACNGTCIVWGPPAATLQGDTFADLDHWKNQMGSMPSVEPMLEIDGESSEVLVTEPVIETHPDGKGGEVQVVAGGAASAEGPSNKEAVALGPQKTFERRRPRKRMPDEAPPREFLRPGHKRKL